MTHLPLPRYRAGTAAALTCLLLATPIIAQESGAGDPAGPATQSGDQPAAPAVPAASGPASQSAAAETAAPETTTSQTAAPESGASSAAAPAGTAPAATDPTTAPASPAPASPATAETAAPAQPAGNQAAAGTAPATSPAETAQEPAAETAQSPADTPVPAPATPETAEPMASTLLPQAVQDALAPVLNAPERDPNLPHDLSPVGMFLAADWVVKAVMIGLAFASVVTWTVLVAKVLELMGAMQRARSGIRRIEEAANLPAALAAAGKRRDPVSRMIQAAAAEYDRSAPALDQAGDAGLKERVDSHLERIEAIAGRRMGRGTGVLATIGSTAPFVGLFGTVWGIMNSFIGISQAQTTNLAVVAPGIAEALLATAIGLIAAIPAVVIYNVFARAVTGYRLRLANAAAGVRRLVSRDLDFRGSHQNMEV